MKLQRKKDRTERQGNSLTGRKIKILLVDDHPLFCEGMRALLEPREGLEIAGQAGNGWEALDLVKKLRPDLVLMDISMPGLNGLAACKMLVEAFSKIKVVILTMHKNKEYILEMIRLGASGYLLKDCAPDDLFRAIQAVHRGENFLSPEAAKVLQEDYNSVMHNRTSRLPQLSRREGEVLALVAQGHPTKAIAHQLQIKYTSVVTYRQRIMGKLKIRNIAGLTQFALRHGYIAPQLGSDLGK